MTNRRQKAAYVLWLGVALLFHSALLLVPISIPPELPAEREMISVTLVTPSIAKPPIAKPPAPKPEITEQTIPETAPEIAAEKKPALIASKPNNAPQVEPLQPTQKPLSKPVTTAQLLRSVAHLKLPLPEEDKPLKLGAVRAAPLPANWLPSFKIEDNLFNGRVAPAGSEILDHWGDASGTQNMVIKTATGHTLCGQSQAWSPMNPLLEHVTMWKPCGGGGKRSSKRRR